MSNSSSAKAEPHEMKRRIAVLGSTGSIGTQALEVIKANRHLFDVEVLSAQNSADLLIRQALEFNPNAVVIGNEKQYLYVKEALADTDVKVFCGQDALCQVVGFESIDMVLTAMVGFAGLKPTIKAIEAGKVVALANKETLVVAGELIMPLAQANKIPVLPVDSEHSAIFQCIQGEFHNPIEYIYLTASGGPFRGRDKAFLASVKKEQALKHPNWCMGNKITIDSASLMNKGLEVIEARWLFGVKPEQIRVIVHPQSIVHSLVQFEDGSMKAQMGLPDMKLPIQYALAYPRRIVSGFERFKFSDYPTLSFEAPDTNTFPNLGLAYMALEKGGTMPCVLNAANEIAVESFLKDHIGFLQMSEVIEQCLGKCSFIARPSLDDLYRSDEEARQYAREIIKKQIK